MNSIQFKKLIEYKICQCLANVWMDSLIKQEKTKSIQMTNDSLLTIHKKKQNFNLY